MMLDEIKSKTRKKMLDSVQLFHNEIRSIRTNKISVSLFNNIVVSIHGGYQKLNQIATISVVNNKTLLIKVWDVSAISKVKNAIISANLNFSLVVDNNTIRVVISDLTQETREKLMRLAQRFAENAKIAIRNIRRATIERMEKTWENKEISKDDLFSAKKQIQNITDDIIKMIDIGLSIKQKDIMNF